MRAFDGITYLHANGALANEAIRRSALRSAQGGSDQNSSNLGIAHTTPARLVASEWELWGDGRAIATDAYRLMRVYSLLGRFHLQESLGTAMQVAMLIRGHLGTIESSGFQAPGLTPNEAAVCSLAKEYCERMHADGAIELCQALPLLKDPMGAMDIRMAEPCILEEPLASFYEGLLGPDGVGDARGACGFDPAHRLESQSKLRLLAPQGTTAVPKMVLEETHRVLDAGSSSIAIVAPDAVGMHRTLAPALRNAGAICSLDAAIPFSSTSFGRFFLSACKLYALAGCFGIDERIEPEDVTWIDAATDVALSEYAGIAPFDSSVLPSMEGRPESVTLRASDLNALWRADRTLTPRAAVLDLMAVSIGFARLDVIFSLEGDPRTSLKRFAEEALRLHGGISAQIEASAVSTLQSLLETAFITECPSSYLALFPFGISMPVRMADQCDEASLGTLGQPGKAPYVSFVSYDRATALAPGTFDAVILCDVTDAYLNASESRISAESIAAKFGAKAKGRRLDRSRQAFSCAMEAANSSFACVFPLLDADADESFTSFAFDEFIDAAFDGALSSSDVIHGDNAARGDGPVEVGEFLAQRVVGAGEEDVEAGIGLRFSAPASTMVLPQVERGHLRYLELPSYLPAITREGERLTVISPSAIEAYLGCPYQWFAERVVRPEALDEGFGPLEAGNFAHSLLRRFYERLMEAFDTDRVTKADPDSVRELFRETADRLFDEQFAAAPCSGRYVPTTNVETLSFERLVMDVYHSLFAFASLPATMSIMAMELPIGQAAPDRPLIAYGGFALTGKVDRIDGGDGSFAVLDYKGSISAYNAGESVVGLISDGHAVAIDPDTLPRHVQSLVYAKALLDAGEHGKRCRGALYASYRSSSPLKLLAGSYEANDSELSALSNGASAVFMDLAEFLAMIESAVGERLEGIGQSRIPIAPLQDDRCRFCPIVTCEGRR